MDTHDKARLADLRKSYERDALDEATDGQLTGCIGLALNAAKDVSADLEESLITHPPAGFWKYQTDGR